MVEQTFPQFFSTFDMDKSGKISQICRKEHLLINKITKFVSDFLKTNEDIAVERRTILEMFVWYSGVRGTNLPPTIQMFANFHNFAELYLCSLKMYHFQTWQFY